MVRHPHRSGPGAPKPGSEGSRKGRQWLYGVQPVLEALEACPERVEKIWIAYGRSGPAIQRILALARRGKVPFSLRDRAALDEKTDGAPHQGVVALAAAAEPVPFDGFLGSLEGKTGILVALLDEVQDPHNLGAILRTACAAGVQAVLLPRHRTCPITPAVVKASAGAAERVPLVRVGSVVRALERLKERGVFILGADPKAEQNLYTAELGRDLCILIGGEGRGLRPVLQRLCDSVVAIPMPGPVESLNASVAAAILFYEVIRRRGAEGSVRHFTDSEK